MDTSSHLIQEYQSVSREELPHLPISALSALPERDSQILKEILRIETIGDLANNHWILTAHHLLYTDLSDEEILERAEGRIDKGIFDVQRADWPHQSLYVLKDLPEAHAIEEHLGIATISQFAELLTPVRRLFEAAEKSDQDENVDVDNHADMLEMLPTESRPALRYAHEMEALLDERGEFNYSAREQAVQDAEAMQHESTQASAPAGAVTAAPASATPLPRGTTAGLHHDNSGWTSLGPHIVGGRTLAILQVKQAQDPTNPTEKKRVLYAGAASGGVWYSDDDGAKWVPTEDLMPNLAVASLVADPDDATGQTLYAGTGEGPNAWAASSTGIPRGAGIFKSTDGWSWRQVAATRVTDTDQRFAAVNRLAFTSDGETLVAATNDGIFYSQRSTDTDKDFKVWTQAKDASNITTAISGKIGSLAAHPTDAKILVASTLAQLSWNRVSGAWKWSSTNAVYLSRDGGKTWKELTQPTVAAQQAMGRVEVCFASATVEIDDPTGTATDGSTVPKIDVYPIYCSAEKKYQSPDAIVWRMTNYKSATANQLDYTGTASNVFGGSGQGWYDNFIWAGDPSDVQLIVVCGVDIFRSLDGGKNFTKIGGYETDTVSERYPHPDQHFLVSDLDYSASNRRVWLGNDGGIYTTDDIKTVEHHVRAAEKVTGQGQWEVRNQGYTVTQFYYGAGNTNNRAVIAGAQDNGTHGHSPGNYDWDNRITGGDGGAVAFDPEDDTRYYTSSQKLNIYRVERSVPTGATKATWSYKANISPLIGDEKPSFIAPFMLDPINNKVLCTGAKSVWRTLDATAASVIWKKLVPTETTTGTDGQLNITSATGKVTAIATGSSTSASTGANYITTLSNLILVGYKGGNIWRTTNANVLDDKLTESPPTWQEISPVSNRKCTSIVIDPKNSSIFYACFGGFTTGTLYKTSDGGADWQDISTGLPNVPVHSITMHRHDSNWLYAGTDVGLFASEDGGTTWAVANEGPASVAVTDMFWMGTTLCVVTFGRGIFQIDIPRLDAVEALLYSDTSGKLTRVLPDQVATYNAVDQSTMTTVESATTDLDTLLSPVLFIHDTNSLADTSGTTLATKVDDTLFVGGANGNLHWLDCDTLASKWTAQKQASAAIEARPELWNDPKDGHLCVVVIDKKGILHIFDLKDESEAETTIDMLGLGTDETAEIYSNEVVDNWAYVVSDKGIYAVRLIGDQPGVEWKKTGADYVCHTAPLLAAGTLYVSTKKDAAYTLRALHVRTGKELWSSAANEVTGEPCPPIWSIGTVVVGTKSNFVAGFDHTTGNRLFNRDAGGAVEGITADDAILYFIANRTLHKSKIVPAATPAAAWELTDVATASVHLGSHYRPLVVGDKIYVSGRNRHLYCYQAEPTAGTTTLSQEWKYRMPSPPHLAPVPVFPASTAA